MIHAIVVDALLALAAFLVVTCALGVAVMRDPLQRLHFIAPPATIASLLVAIALFVDEPQRTAGAKALVAFVCLSLLNAVVTHATARAWRTRELGHWAPFEWERIPWVNGGFVPGNPPGTDETAREREPAGEEPEMPAPEPPGAAP